MSNEIQHENDVTRLTVPQVILLCLLTTIVASVATAIVVVQLTASLRGDTIFQTIDRVTETVVERPVIGDKPQTVIIKEGDLVAKAVNTVAGTAESIFSQTSEGEIINLTDGYKISPTQLLSAPVTDIVGSVTAGFVPVGYFGSDRVMLWQTIGDEVFTAPFVDFAQGNIQVGQTMIYVGADGKIIKGLAQRVSDTGIEFSENLTLQKTGLLLEIGGKVVGLWNGTEVLRANAIATQISQLKDNEFVTSTNETVIDNTQTNDDSLTDGEKKSGCELIGGTFNEFNECLGVNNSQCLVLGGEYNECASACRNDPNAEVCTQQCVVMCQL